MVTMKVFYEDPHGVLSAFVVIFICCVPIISLVLIVASSIGINVGNLIIWTNTFTGSVTFVFGYALGGNINEKRVDK
ncbi:MAG: hypothetical protein WCE94_10635 [Candidatus Methanoperedens sp.]